MKETNTATKPLSKEEYRRILHKRMLTYGFVASIIGLPVGILLNLPYVWVLATIGIVVGGIKLVLRQKK